MKLGGHELLEEIARGGMGVVYRARGPLGEVAIKRLLSADTDPRFEQEARAAARLRHPGIVRVHDMGHDDQGRAYLVLELIEGVSLSERLKLGPFAIEEARAHALELCEALEYAHAQGVIHRDLKPANVLLTHTGAVKLTDFGLAKVLDRSQGDSLTRTGEIMGTPAYMPPEQALGDKGLMGPRSDVYGLGATLYALLTGRAPFRAPTAINLIHAVLEQAPQPPSTHVPEVPPWLDALVLRCLAKAPRDRYASVAELRQALLAPPSESSPLRRGGALLVGLVAVVGLALAGALLARPRSDTIEASSPAATPLEADYERAETLANQGRYREAEGLFSAILARDPQHARAYRERARARGNQGDVDGARSDLDQAIALDPDDAEALFLRGYAEGLTDVQRALEYLDASLRLAPAHLLARKARASYRGMLGDWEGSLEDCEQALLVDGADVSVRMWQAEALLNLEADPKWVLESLDAVLRLEPTQAWALRQRLLVRGLAGDVEGALSDAELLAELDPGDPQNLENLELVRGALNSARGQALAAEGRFAEAIEVANERLAQYPADGGALLRRGQAKFRLGRIAEARDDFDQAIEAKPDLAMAYANRSTARLELGNPADALADAERAVELRPDLAYALAARATARLELGDPEGALQDSARALEQDAGAWGAYVVRGKIRRLRGDLALAKADLAKAVQLLPYHLGARIDYARLLRELGELQASLEQLDEVLRLSPRDAEALGERGWTHAGLGDYEAARQDLELAEQLQSTPANAERLKEVLAALAGESPAGPNDDE